MAAPEIQSPRARPPGLIQRYREELQARHYARRTVATYPPEMGSAEVNAFLTHLAVEGKAGLIQSIKSVQGWAAASPWPAAL